MARVSKWLVALAGCITIGSGAACSASADAPANAPDVRDDDIIGGVDAKSAKLDAVGSLLLDANGVKSAFCTGPLIAPTIVLTAKHCTTQLADPATGAVEQLFTQLGTVSFAIGSDSAAPKREVKAKSLDRARLAVGGIGYGADVAVYILAEPITDIAPLPVASALLGEQDVSKAFVAIGYGVRDRAMNAGLRTMGNITLSILTGKPYESAF
jgi:hypothetical protein